MGMNIVNLSGQIDKVFWKPAGSPTRSGPSKYPRLSMRYSFSDVPVFTPDGQQMMIQNQKIWVTLTVPNVKGQRTPDVQRIERFSQGADSSYCQAMLTNGTYNVWGNPPKPELKAPFYDLYVGSQPLHPMNRSIIQGKVHNQDGHWMHVEDRYSVPGRGGSAPTWKSRLIPVYLQQQMASLQGKVVLVFGALSAHTLVNQGQGWMPQEFMHVIAEEVHACLG